MAPHFELKLKQAIVQSKHSKRKEEIDFFNY